jgi:hypothetical protein
MRYLFTLLLFCCALPALAQRYTYNPDTLGVRLMADPRLDILLKKTEGGVRRQATSNAPSGVIRSGRGFRIQIYNGNDRVAATRTKIDFIRRFPGTRSYMNYLAPTFRVRVGDFRSRADAQRFYSQVSAYFSPCMIVPDIIEINTLRDGNND